MHDDDSDGNKADESVPFTESDKSGTKDGDSSDDIPNPPSATPEPPESSSDGKENQ